MRKIPSVRRFSSEPISNRWELNLKNFLYCYSIPCLQAASKKRIRGRVRIKSDFIRSLYMAVPPFIALWYATVSGFQHNRTGTSFLSMWFSKKLKFIFQSKIESSGYQVAKFQKLKIGNGSDAILFHPKIRDVIKRPKSHRDLYSHIIKLYQ